MHRFLLISCQLEGLANGHDEKGNEESAPESGDHDDYTSHVRVRHEVTKTHSGDRNYDDPNSLKVAIKVDHLELPIVFDLKDSKEVCQHKCGYCNGNKCGETGTFDNHALECESDICCESICITL